ncbi:hypothetical protein [Paracoccus sp. (in: a-proteobacteria)]|uniref:hypothetical protein n=1 Tax=Paracoccus sp. TaxID=267 RepID=UPI0026DFC82F|nr:hypothetical protein [Paracoccus sp. (in: a-proteobacteria)]MDO5646674.1 hypothetical protein [Paracoccus sp. (in: a-proteobacteria)]
MRYIAIFALPTLLAACAGVQSDHARAVMAPGTCQGEAPPAITGMNIGEVYPLPGQRMVVVNPGGVAPQNDRPGRIVVHVDEKGWITRADCG